MSDSIDYGMLVEEEPVRRQRYTAIVDETEVGSKWWGDVDVGDHYSYETVEKYNTRANYLYEAGTIGAMAASRSPALPVGQQVLNALVAGVGPLGVVTGAIGAGVDIMKYRENNKLIKGVKTVNLNSISKGILTGLETNRQNLFIDIDVGLTGTAVCAITTGVALAGVAIATPIGWAIFSGLAVFTSIFLIRRMYRSRAHNSTKKKYRGGPQGLDT